MQAFAAILDPLYGAAQLTGGERNEIVFGVELAANAEAAADIKLDHLDRFNRQPQHRSQHLARGVWDFGGTMNGELFGCGVPIGNQSARFHRRSGLTIGAQRSALNVISTSKG